MKFEEMKLNEKLKKAIKEMKYETATEVQEKSIPIIVDGDNLICKSFTGSGKTAAFGLGISERLLNGKTNGILIIDPTRELAVQVREELQKINRYSGIKVQVVYGGHGIVNEIAAIKKGVDILVATPGRLLDHIQNRVIKREDFDTVVLDEADRMLDMGFIDDLNKVLEYVKPKNTLLFSATLDPDIVKLIHKYIPNYKEVMVKTEILGTNIIEKNIEMQGKDKFLYLLEIVKKAEGKRVLVFVSKKSDADNLERKLGKSGFNVASIHGDKSQRFREYALKDFKAGKVNILVATDVAARGLQIDNVEFVVNYDSARDKDTHKHRIGRTGRMGAIGYAVNFLTEDDVYKNSRREGKRPVRSKHSIDNKSNNIWDLANKSRPKFGSRSRDNDSRPRFGDRDRSRFNDTKKDFDNEKPKFDDSKYEKKFDKPEEPLEKPNFDSEKKHDFKDHRVASGSFVPKSFRREKEYMNSRPEYKEKAKEEFEKKSEADLDIKLKRDRRDSPRDGPRKSFNDRDKPRRSFGDRDKPRFGSRDSSDRPRRSFGDKPFGNREHRGRTDMGNDAPRRDSNSRFRIKPKFGEDNPGEFPRKNFDSRRRKDSDRPRSFDDRPSFGERKSFGDRPRFGDRERTSRDFSDKPRDKDKDKDNKKKEPHKNLKKGKNMKFQGRFPRKSF